MKILKFLLWTAVILAVIYLILCLAGPKSMAPTSTLNMKASPASIIETVSDFNQWKTFSPWYKLDTTATQTVSGTPGTVGHKMEWDSPHKYVKKGSQTITEIGPDHVKAHLVFMGDTSHAAYGEWKFETAGDSTKVTWGMLPGEIPFFSRGFALVMGLEGMMNDMFGKGLKDLKPIVEAKVVAPAVSFDVVEMGDQWYIGQMFPGTNFETTPGDVMMKMYDDAYAAIDAHLVSMKTAAAGPYLSIAHKFNEETMVADLEIAIPVADSMAAPKGFSAGKIPAGKSAKYEYVGGYSGIPAAWGEFMGAAMGGGNTPRWSFYEVYMVGPGTEPDSTKWITHLVVPVQ